jgi:hypothetical protein
VSFCAAVDRSGAVITSTDPGAGASAWTETRVDGSNQLIDISCPSVALCVAVDNAGNVVSSTDPGGGASMWHVVNVEGTASFAAVSCPSASLCVGAAGRDLVVSSSPAGGASAWTIDRNADAGTGPECGKYGGASNCYASLTFLSCPTVTFCEGIDGYAARVSGNPSTQTWQSSEGDGEDIEGLACLPDSVCLTLCADGSGLGGFDCGSGQGDYYAAILCASRGCFELSPGAPAGLWCGSGSSCFAADGNGSLFEASDPTGGRPAWTTAYLPPASTEPIIITGVACPGASLCIAVTDDGDLLVGAPPATPAQIKAMLYTQLIPKQRDAAVRALLRRGGYSFSFYAPVAGDLRITWSATAKQRNRAQHIVIARANGAADTPASLKLKLALTHAGRQLFRRLKRIRLSLTATLSRTALPAIVVTRKFAAIR